MSKPIGPGVTRANTVRVWHVGQSGRRMVMMLSPSRSGGSVTDSQSPEDTKGRWRSQHGTLAVPRLVNFAHFRKIDNMQAPRLSLRTLPCECPAWIEDRASRRWNPNCSCSVRHRLRPPNQSSRPYAQDLRFNAGIAASSVVRSEKPARLSQCPGDRDPSRCKAR